jgi:hypothetical protein
MTKGVRIATYTGSAVGILFVVCLGLIKLSESSAGPKPHPGKNLTPVSITLSVNGSGQCVQQVDGKNINFPGIYEGQGVTWTASQGWSSSFQSATVLPPNTGTPFEDTNGDWQPNFSGTPPTPTPSGPSVLTFWETLYYSFSTQQVTFNYSSITINGTPCSGASNMGLIVHAGG